MASKLASHQRVSACVSQSVGRSVGQSVSISQSVRVSHASSASSDIPGATHATRDTRRVMVVTVLATVRGVVGGAVLEGEALVVMLVVSPLLLDFSSADGSGSGGHAKLTLRPPNIKPERREGSHLGGHGMEQDQETEVPLHACVPVLVPQLNHRSLTQELEQPFLQPAQRPVEGLRANDRRDAHLRLLLPLLHGGRPDRVVRHGLGRCGRVAPLDVVRKQAMDKVVRHAPRHDRLQRSYTRRCPYRVPRHVVGRGGC
mmetsp:Transcript_37850/g.94881  ORF Transcript_37850/g.94881 Transcript_37850/m.94881 type:complete len:258 (+) Transcript_37850:132-905(+)